MDASWVQNIMGFLKSDNGKNMMSAAGNMDGGGNDANSTSQIVHTAYRGVTEPEEVKKEETKPAATINSGMGEDNFLTKLLSGIKNFQGNQQEAQQ